MPLQRPPSPLHRVTRRQFLKWLSSAGAAIAAAGCSPEQPAPPVPTGTPTAIPSSTPTIPPPTSSPTLAPSATPTLTPTPLPRSAVAIGRAAAYEPGLLRQQLETMLDSLGGLDSLVRPGARVGIKVNMTGSSVWDSPDKPPAVEYFVTHPGVVGALCELLRDAGAGKLYIMDGLFEEACFTKWGYTDVAKPMGADLINLCKPAPYGGYATFPVGTDPLIYDHFSLNGLLGELDLFVSVAKMKPHSTTGVTLAMKNLVGITPLEEYRLKESHTNRTALHGYAHFDTRMPRVIVDLNRACPVHLAIIDGIMTSEGGPGPWQATLAQVRPGILVAGKDPVAVDAVSAAVMGFDPEAAPPALPFLHGENHLALASQAGIGAYRLQEIPVVGVPVQEALYRFKPSP